MRAKIRQAAGTQSLLSSKAKRERAVAALQQGAIAIDAASRLTKGKASCVRRRAQCSACLAMSALLPPVKSTPFLHATEL